MKFGDSLNRHAGCVNCKDTWDSKISGVTQPMDGLKNSEKLQQHLSRQSVLGSVLLLCTERDGKWVGHLEPAWPRHLQSAEKAGQVYSKRKIKTTP